MGEFILFLLFCFLGGFMSLFILGGWIDADIFDV